MLLLPLSCSVVSDSVRPQRQQPTRLPVPGILQARALEWVAIAFSDKSTLAATIVPLLVFSFF